MKKIYIAPQTEQINILTEGVVAASLPMDPNKQVDTNTGQLSQKRGWSCDNWVAGDEE